MVICTPVPKRYPRTHKLLGDNFYKRSQSSTESIFSLLPHAFSLPPPQFPLHDPVSLWKDCRSMHTSHSPIFSVTVMMFRDMVESVMLLKDEDCNVSET